MWQAAQAAGRVLVTQDLDFSDVRTFSPGNGKIAYVTADDSSDLPDEGVLRCLLREYVRDGGLSSAAWRAP